MSFEGPLFERVSPNGNVSALVEDDGRAVFFFLRYDHPPPNQQAIRGCWVRNRQPAPMTVDYRAWEKGESVMLPSDLCRHPQGAPALSRANLSIVWFEEGNGAALLEGEEVLAVIPPWSGHDGFNGYARDCRSECPLCWPLKSQFSLLENIRRAQDYWKCWDDKKFWEAYRTQMTDKLEQAFGRQTKYYAIDGGKWPPKALLRFAYKSRHVFSTVGMSLRPQSIDRAADDAAKWRRIELAAAVDQKCPEAELLTYGKFLSVCSSRPWTNYEWMGEGHILPCNAAPPSLGGKRFEAVILLRLPPQVALPSFRGDTVSLLWMVPVTWPEREFAANYGWKALVARLKKAGCTGVHTNRKEAPLK